jgi:hypothetical protein
LFYRTDHGTVVSNLFMNLTHTAALNQADPFTSMVALLRHAKAVAAAPAEWMPWNHRARLSRPEQATT